MFLQEYSSADAYFPLVLERVFVRSAHVSERVSVRSWDKYFTNRSQSQPIRTLFRVRSSCGGLGLELYVHEYTAVVTIFWDISSTHGTRGTDCCRCATSKTGEETPMALLVYLACVPTSSPVVALHYKTRCLPLTPPAHEAMLWPTLCSRPCGKRLLAVGGPCRLVTAAVECGRKSGLHLVLYGYVRTQEQLLATTLFVDP